MIEAEAAKLGHSITRDSLRVKFSRYKKAGYVRPAMDPFMPKLSQGAYWVTESGKLFFGLTKRESSSQKQTTTALPTPSLSWDQKALNINPTVRAVR